MAPTHMFDMSGDIFCEQRSMATKFGFLETPWRILPNHQGCGLMPLRWLEQQTFLRRLALAHWFPGRKELILGIAIIAHTEICA